MTWQTKHALRLKFGLPKRACASGPVGSRPETRGWPPRSEELRNSGQQGLRPSHSMSSPTKPLFASAVRMASGLLLLVGASALSATPPGASALSATTTQQRVTLGRVRPIVAPSVAKANFLALGSELEACTAAGCEWLHCSVQDGVFVPKVSFGH